VGEPKRFKGKGRKERPKGRAQRRKELPEKQDEGVGHSEKKGQTQSGQALEAAKSTKTRRGERGRGRSSGTKRERKKKNWAIIRIKAGPSGLRSRREKNNGFGGKESGLWELRITDSWSSTEVG